MALFSSKDRIFSSCNCFRGKLCGLKMCEPFSFAVDLRQMLSSMLVEFKPLTANVKAYQTILKRYTIQSRKNIRKRPPFLQTPQSMRSTGFLAAPRGQNTPNPTCPKSHRADGFGFLDAPPFRRSRVSFALLYHLHLVFSKGSKKFRLVFWTRFSGVCFECF